MSRLLSAETVSHPGLFVTEKAGLIAERRFDVRLARGAKRNRRLRDQAITNVATLWYLVMF
jgi:hypothetical protein